MSTGVQQATARPRERNRRGEGGRLRADILDAATKLLDRGGDEQAVTLRAVARHVGISAPSIYPHFRDRQAILSSLVHDAFAELEQALQEAAAGVDDPVACLYTLATAYLDFATTRPQRYRVMFGGVWNGARAVEGGAVSQAQVDALGQGSLRLLAATLEAVAAAGHSASTDPLADAVALWVALHGLASQRAAAPLFPWPDGFAAQLVDRVSLLKPADR
ncbi:TetR/AcrR family transcriptional regulator [Modestobacter sp. SSW1-42]|uniref:TetR/AcrR family transcriptional regulator n=1 Tax=Modestobacter sp. SSW1-42 TaxID=596372 RepID=UPI003985A52B